MNLLFGIGGGIVFYLIIGNAFGLFDEKPEDKNKPVAKRSYPLKWGSSKKF